MDGKLIKLVCSTPFVLALATAFPAGGAAQTGSCVPPPSGLVSWWPGDGNADDLAGANPGILQNNVAFEPGFVNAGTSQALSFDGGDAFILLPQNASLNVRSHTIEAWIKTADFIPADFLSILSKTLQSPPERTFGLFIARAQAPFAAGTVLNSFSQQSQFFGSSGTTKVTNGLFNHIAVSYDAITRSKRVYVNGILEDEDILGDATGPEIIPDTHGGPASIGAVFGDNPFSLTNRFIGLIDELALFSRALDPGEIAAIHAADTFGKCRPGSAPAASAVTKTLVSGPLELLDGALADVLDSDGEALGAGEILVNHDRAQFFSFAIALVNDTSEPLSRVISDAIPKIFELSEDGEDAADGALDEICDDGICDGLTLDQSGDACTARAVDPEDADEALDDVFEVEATLIIVCNGLAVDDTATLTVWVETGKSDKDRYRVTRFNPAACLVIANDGTVAVNEAVTLNPGTKLYDPADGRLIGGPAQSIQLQPVSAAGCFAPAEREDDDDDEDDDRRTRDDDDRRSRHGGNRHSRRDDD